MASAERRLLIDCERTSAADRDPNRAARGDALGVPGDPEPAGLGSGPGAPEATETFVNIDRTFVNIENSTFPHEGDEMMRFRKATRAAAVALALPALALTTAQVSAQQEGQEQQREHAVQQAEQEQNHLMAEARQAEDLSLFVQALDRTGLATVLESEGPFTVFAPTNEALEEHFSEEELSLVRGQGEIPAEKKDKLAHVVRAHIVTGQMASGQLQNAENVRNVLGNELAIGSETAAAAMARTETETDRPEREERQGEQEEAEPQMEPAARTASELQVESAAVVRTDIRASNGIIHVIDAVIEPGPMKDQAKQGQEQQPYEPPAKETEETPPPTG